MPITTTKTLIDTSKDHNHPQPQPKHNQTQPQPKHNQWQPLTTITMDNYNHRRNNQPPLKTRPTTITIQITNQKQPKATTIEGFHQITCRLFWPPHNYWLLWTIDENHHIDKVNGDSISIAIVMIGIQPEILGLSRWQHCCRRRERKQEKDSMRDKNFFLKIF